MNNYPPGVSGKEFEDTSEQEREQAQDELDITYRLVVETADGEVLYEDTFFSQDSLQESGLRKADHAVEEAINARVELNNYIAKND